ncbi:MAG TPA: YceI family protein [Nitrolancea sp.]|nr:YceI family protein [Nitrolancea sp.]
MSSSSAAQATSNTGISTWTIDPVHSSVEFSVKHMMIATVKGQFSQVEGLIRFDPASHETAEVDAKIDTTSITTFNEGRDNHLRTNDFFNAEEFRYITFTSSSVEKAGQDHYKVHGDLTIRDVTKPVVLDTEFDGQIVDAYGKDRAAFTAATEINRRDFGVNWNAAIEGGGVVVSDKVKITLHISAVRQE